MIVALPSVMFGEWWIVAEPQELDVSGVHSESMNRKTRTMSESL